VSVACISVYTVHNHALRRYIIGFWCVYDAECSFTGVGQVRTQEERGFGKKYACVGGRSKSAPFSSVHTLFPKLTRQRVSFFRECWLALRPKPILATVFEPLFGKQAQMGRAEYIN
jgi:hypothetical protein